MKQNVKKGKGTVSNSEQEKIKRKKFKQKYRRKLENVDKESAIKFREDAESVIDTKKLLDELFFNMLSLPIEDGIKWLLGLEEYVQDKSEKERLNYRRYQRGHVVELELFGHFSEELTFSHPAVVLYNEKNFVLVAPVTSGKFGSGKPLHIDVGQEDGFSKNCAIVLDAMKLVHKQRILYQHKQSDRVSNLKLDDTVLDKIDKLILEHYLPVTYQKVQSLEGELNNQKLQYEELQQELVELKKELENYKQKV
ncbi:MULTISPECIES: type II toxin-antitoxin system PemK/MazF family toxin [Bacillus cereus group]|uniref:Uncharacterized protein n=1 Tax=Bacillus anthracis TaxID=1392 RepID=A0A2A7DAW8_BACAN|nr:MULTISPECIES: type II toxin-antitoxin system PemK/MazF family toxin [Bacillus cereus group]PDZ17114.1 hypothetical protein CON16_10565 [Bacillus anthracis]